jgi:hypothetical protein
VKVKRAHADFHLSAGRLTQAAQQFAHTGLPFAQIALLLVNCAPAFTSFLAANHASTSTSITNGVFGPRDKDGVVYPVSHKMYLPTYVNIFVCMQGCNIIMHLF